MCNSDLRDTLSSNIVLTGSSTLFQGFPERLENEVKQLSFNKDKVKVIADDDRDNLSWLGGSVLSSLT